jgi:nucleotide-binding universal stress UspA family protein
MEGEMSGWKNILMGTDFSEASRRALETALWLARGAAGKLTVAHACVDFMMPDGAIMTPERWNRLRLAAYEEAHGQLGVFLGSQDTDDLDLDRQIIFGGASEQLARLAHDKAADLVVVGAVGRGLLERLLLGSTTEALVRAAQAPVWVARRGLRGLKEIIVAVDGSPESVGVTRAAASLARAHDARLTLLQAYPDLSGAPVFAQADAAQRDLLQGDQLARAQRQLEALRDALGDALQGLRVDAQILPGRASRVIVEQAREAGAELVVVGTHGHGALYRLAVGTTTARVLREAPCDVLVIPGDARLTD